LRKAVYRTQCFKREIDRDNWDLSQLPIDVNGMLRGEINRSQALFGVKIILSLLTIAGHVLEGT
jgi:hypothetical protein